MTFQHRLFRHINGLWLMNLHQMQAIETDNYIAEQLYKQVIKRLPEGNICDLCEEGYRIGHAIDDHYKATKVFELPDLSGLPLKDVDKKEYIEYLRANIHAWAVPLSYHSLLTSPRAGFDKRLNLWGSTQSHKRYFRTLIDMIVNHLKCSESELPVGFIDVGCGDGSLLRDLKTALAGVFNRTFLFIGFDVDDQSSRIAKEQGQDKILFLRGDVAKPEELNASLIAQGYPPLDHFFQVRAFVDHNSKPFFDDEYEEGDPSTCNYCYIHNDRFVSENFIENSFKTHFARWKPFISRYGLGIIELHKAESYNLTESPAIAYEIFHLVSEQYVLSYKMYSELWENAGVTLLDKKSIPNHSLSPNVSISIYQ